MKNRSSLTLSLLLLVTLAFGQRQVDSLNLLLNTSESNAVRCDVLLELARHYIHKPGELQTDFDSAMVYIEQVRTLTSQDKSSAAYGYLVLMESYLAKEKGDNAEAKRKAEESIRILESENNLTYLGRAYFELSRHYNHQDSVQLVERITLVEKSVDAFRKGKNFKEEAMGLEMLGDLHIVFEHFDKAIPVLKQALVAYDSIGYTETQGVHLLIGDVYNRIQDNGNAFSHLIKALKIAQAHKVTSMQLCQINFLLGIFYKSIGRTDLQLKYWSDGLQVAKNHNDKNAICLLASNVSDSYIELKQPDQALNVLNSIPSEVWGSAGIYEKMSINSSYCKTYAELRQFGNAKSYCDTIQKLAATRIVSERFRSMLYRVITKYYFDQKEYKKARLFLEQATVLAQFSKHQLGLTSVEQQWYKLDSAQGNFHSAFTHLLAYKAKTDSATAEKNMRQIQVLSMEYEVGMKQDSIKLKDKDIQLLTQTNALQQKNLQQASVVRNLTIAGIIAALAIAGLLYRQNSTNKKNNFLITHKNSQLQHLLSEKEWLLKEIHHRVKNNLQIVMSLLNSQSAYISNQPALTAIHDSQHRIHAMSLIHQKLYNADNVSSINMSSYIRELVTYLADSFDACRQIRFEFAIDPLEMDVSQAIPLGLILNEAITNALKYAFPDGRGGTISITLSNTSPGHYLLVIADDGIGMQLTVADKKKGSLGMSLMEGLTEDLEGKFAIENHKGTSIKISFVHGIGTIRQNAPATPSRSLRNMQYT